jgi:hypothetical protein
VPARVTFAEQEAAVPPYSPLQLQVHEPGFVTGEAMPVEQRLAAGGATENDPLLADPHAPLTGPGMLVVKVENT